MTYRGAVLTLVGLMTVLVSSCAQPAEEDASFESQEDVIAALDDGGRPCSRVDVRVRDWEGQVLVDSSQDGGRLDAFTHETEQDRLTALIAGFGSGVLAIPDANTLPKSEVPIGSCHRVTSLPGSA